MEPRLSFSYWSDPLCVWAFVAQERLDRIVAELGERLHVNYRVVVVFGSLPWRFERGPWAEAGPAGRRQLTRDIAAQHGHPEVDGAFMEGDCPATSWAPAAAIKAVCELERLGEAPDGAGARYQKALRHSLFVDNRNVARRSVQLELCEAQDLSRAAVERRLDDGSALAQVWEDQNEKDRLRLQGSPTYVFDSGRAMLYGNVAYGVLHATVDELLRGLRPEGSAC
jgi:predicted DsbA family dithiol-disulfide isomerase